MYSQQTLPAQVGDYERQKFRSNTSIYVAICFNSFIIVFNIAILGTGAWSVAVFHTMSKSQAADILEFGFIALAVISLVLTIACVVLESFLASQDEQNRNFNTADLWCSVAASVTLLVGSIMIIAGWYTRCESLPHEEGSSVGCGVAGIFEIPTGAAGIITALMYAGPITSAACPLCNKDDKPPPQENVVIQYQPAPNYYDQQAPPMDPAQQQQTMMYYQPQQQAPDGSYYYSNPAYNTNTNPNAPPPAQQTY